MKAISLWQPWASLIALGAKTIETRGWATPYRGPLAIHATKGNCEVGQLGDFHVEKDNPRGSEPAFLLRGESLAWPYRLPLGAVVATCRLVDCVRTERIQWEPDRFEVKGRMVQWARTGMLDHADARVAEEQRPYGDYTPSRWAWLLVDIEPIRQPRPARGRQQLWDWEPEVVNA